MKKIAIFLAIASLAVGASWVPQARADGTSEIISNLPGDAQCQFEVWWRKDPGTTIVNEGKTATFKFGITNWEYPDKMHFVITTSDKNIQFQKTDFYSNETFMEMTITITMPKRQSGQKVAYWSFKITSDCGRHYSVKFHVHYPEECCSYKTSWEKEPASFKVAQNKTCSFKFVVENKCSEAPIDFQLSSNISSLGFSRKSFTVQPGKKFEITVTIKQPSQGGKSKSDWSFKIKPACGQEKQVSFSVKYP